MILTQPRASADARCLLAAINCNQVHVIDESKRMTPTFPFCVKGMEEIGVGVEGGRARQGFGHGPLGCLEKTFSLLQEFRAKETTNMQEGFGEGGEGLALFLEKLGPHSVPALHTTCSPYARAKRGFG